MGIIFERQLRSEEHTSELQSRLHLVCRLLLEKKNVTPIAKSHRQQLTDREEPSERVASVGYLSTREGPSAAGALLFFFNDTRTTEIYTLSLHDALPISVQLAASQTVSFPSPDTDTAKLPSPLIARSEEHTSELQSRLDLVCRLLLE